MLSNRLEATPALLEAYTRMMERGEADTNGGCLLWPGAAGRQGYGNVKAGEATELTHRVAHVARHGDLPAGVQVLHKCDVPACFRDEHLFSGTQVDNMRDAVAKGRHRAQVYGLQQDGEANPAAKLTAAAVAQIRARRTETKAALAREFGVCRATIRAILSGKTWAAS